MSIIEINYPTYYGILTFNAMTRDKNADFNSFKSEFFGCWEMDKRGYKFTDSIDFSPSTIAKVISDNMFNNTGDFINRAVTVLYASGYTEVLDDAPKALECFQKDHGLKINKHMLLPETIKALDMEAYTIEKEFGKHITEHEIKKMPQHSGKDSIICKSIIAGKLKGFNFPARDKAGTLSDIYGVNGMLMAAGYDRNMPYGSPAFEQIIRDKGIRAARKDAGLPEEGGIDKETMIYLYKKLSDYDGINKRKLAPLTDYLKANGINLEIVNESMILSDVEAGVLFECLKKIPVKHLKVIDKIYLTQFAGMGNAGDIGGNSAFIVIDSFDTSWKTTLFHEIGHIIDFRLRKGSKGSPSIANDSQNELVRGFWKNYDVDLRKDDPDIPFYNISFKNDFFTPRDPSKAEDFVRNYARTHGPNDFACHYEGYLSYEPYFGYMTKYSGPLKQKYDYMKNVVFEGWKHPRNADIVDGSLRPEKLRPLMSGLDAGSAMKTIEALAGLKTRMSGTEGNAAAFEWIGSKLLEMKIGHKVETFEYKGRIYRNIIVDLKGSESSGGYVYLLAHYDSMNIKGDPQEPATGADDDASGVALLLEYAKAIQSHKFKKNIRIMFTDGEEQGLVGTAYHLAQNNDKITAAVSFDMVGHLTDGKPLVNCTSPQEYNMANRYLCKTAERLVPDVKFDPVEDWAKGDADLFSAYGYPVFKVTDYDHKRTIKENEWHVNDVIKRISPDQIKQSMQFGIAVISLLAHLEE